MILNIFLIIYEFAWVLGLYGLSYRFVNFLLQDNNSKILKVVFDVDLRNFQFNMESATKEQHNVLHFLASCITFLLLSVHPIVHSLVFVWFCFLDVTQLNRLVLYVLLLKNNTFPPDTLSVLQIIATCLNFYDSSYIFSTLFFLIDSIFYIDYLFIEMSRIHTEVLVSDTVFLKKVYDIITFFKTSVKTLRYVRLVVLVTITLTSITYSKRFTFTDFAFYLYGSYRIATVYTNDEKKRK